MIFQTWRRSLARGLELSLTFFKSANSAGSTNCIVSKHNSYISSPQNILFLQISMVKVDWRTAAGDVAHLAPTRRTFSRAPWSP